MNTNKTKFKRCFLNEEEEWICDDFFCKLSYIIQYYCLKTNYFSIYENG